MLSNPRLGSTGVMSDVMDLMERWYVSISGTGALAFQPRHARVQLRDFVLLIRRLEPLISPDWPSCLLIDLDGAEVGVRQWPSVLQLMRELSARMQGDCTVITRSLNMASRDSEASAANRGLPVQTRIGHPLDVSTVGARAYIAIRRGRARARIDGDDWVLE
ncbi:MAG TPA: hypothetical protein VMV81_03615, partial [Phycisphaerae bacterium]|nr:hypothetical protein [Phycisphaerae bacterium]